MCCAGHYNFFSVYILYICSFHNKLKTNPCYLNHQINRRYDDLIEFLLKFEENTFYERMRKDIMMRPEDASLKLQGCDWHNKGSEIDDLAVTVGDNLFAP